MPILDVTIVHGADEALPADLAQRLADAAAQVFGDPPGRVWVTVTAVPAARYAENGTPAAETPHPVLVRVLKATAPADPANEARALAESLAAAAGRATEHLHLLYEPPAAGRIAFGGVLRKP